MVRMNDGPATTLPRMRLSGISQLYVTSVGAMAVLTVLEGSTAWYITLIVLALPLSLLALWVGFYAGLAVGFAVGADVSHISWPMAVVWVAVWTMTAWINAQLGQKVLRRGWATIAPRPRVPDPENDVY